jgi:hypothetical protein
MCETMTNPPAIAGAVKERNPSTKPNRNDGRNTIIVCPHKCLTPDH